MATYKRKRSDELGSLKKLQTRSSSSSLSNLSGGGVKKISSSALSDLEKAQRQEQTTIGNLNAYGTTEKQATDDRNFIEKGLGLKSNQGFFGDVFEVLGKPQQAIVGAGMNSNPFEGAWKGLSGQSHYTGEEVGHALGITNDNSPQWLKTLTGFGLDMATDPLAYTNAPFEWAGTKIKGLAQKGYKTAVSALSKTEKGSELVRNLESTLDKMSSVTKSAFGLWKSKDFKGFKNDLLNKANMSAVSKEGIAQVMGNIGEDVRKFASDMHTNPQQFAAERKALNLSEDASEEQVSKAISDDLMNALEANKKDSLSKAQVYNNLGKPSSADNESGRFLITGDDAEKQAKGIMKEIKQDWAKANGRPLRDDELSFTNGYINAGPEVSAFLRRTKAGYDNVSTRLNLFGVQGRLEGALQTLGRSGAVTFNIEDDAEKAMVDEIFSRFGSKAKIRYGAGTASVQLNAKEFRDFMKTQEVQRIFRDSKNFGKNQRSLQLLMEKQNMIQQRIRATGIRKNEKIAAINKRSEELLEETSQIYAKKMEIEEAKAELVKEVMSNEIILGKINTTVTGKQVNESVTLTSGEIKKLSKDVTYDDATAVADKMFVVYNELLEQMPGLRDVLTQERLENMVTKFIAQHSDEAQSAGGSFLHTRTGYKDDNGAIRAGMGESVVTIDGNITGLEYASLEHVIIHELLHAVDSSVSITDFADVMKGEDRMVGTVVGGSATQPNDRIIYNNSEQNRRYGGKEGSEDFIARSGESFKSGNFYKNNILNHLTREMQKKPYLWKEEISALRKDYELLLSQDSFIPLFGMQDITDKEFMDMYIKRAERIANGKLESILDLTDTDRYQFIDESGVFYDPEDVAENDPYAMDYYENDPDAMSIDEAKEAYFGDWIGLEDKMKAEMGEEEFLEELNNLSQDNINERWLYAEFFEGTHTPWAISGNLHGTPEALVSGSSSEYWSEILGNHLTGDLAKANSKRYSNFIEGYSKDVMGVEIKRGRKISVEQSQYTKEMAKLRGTERLNERQWKAAQVKRVKIEKDTMEELNKLDGSKESLAEKTKSMQSKVNRQSNTINRISRETDMNLTKDTTNGELSAEMVKKTKVKTAIKLNGAGQKEVQQLNAELKRWRAFNDNNFYKVKMRDSVLVDVSKDFQRIANSLEGAKQQIYDMIEKTYAAEGTQLGEVLKNLNVDGYMRHVINPDAMIYNEIKKLRSGGKLAGAKARELVGNLGDNSNFFEKNWYGSATEINDKLGVELFNTNPIESMAVLLQLLPEHFEVAHILQGAFDTKLIRELGEDEVNSVIDLIEANRNEGMTAAAARANALKQILPDEFTMVDANVKQKLLNSFDFLEKGGAKGEEVEALKQQIQKIDESQGMIIHKGMLNQIHRYGKKLRNRDVRDILDKVKKYFVNPFKSLATLSLGFHVRNNVTNVTNAYLAGMNPTHYFKHFTSATKDLTTVERAIIPKLQRMVRSGKSEIKTIAGQQKWIEKNFNAEEKRLYNKMHEWQAKGVMGINRFSGDLADLISGISKEGTSSKLGKGFKKVTEASMKIGKLSDDASKIATYEWAKNTKAGKAVLASHGMQEPEEFSKFVFFDYSDLTEFESKYMKAIFPFYTWTRKNIEFQIKNFLINSNRYVRMNKVISHWQDYMSNGNKDQLSSYDVEDMLIPISNSDGTTTMLKVSPGFLDISDTISNPLNKISPLIKAPLEAWSGTNFFSGRSVDTGPFGQFSQEMFGDFGELGKGLRGEDYDKTKMGLIGNKVMAGKTALSSIVNGQPTAGSIAPSIFRETNNEDTEAQNIQNRITQSKAYIQKLQQKGATPDARLLPRNRVKSVGNGYTRAGTKYNI